MDSILDRILTQKHAEEIREFNPVLLVQSLLATLSSRERDVVQRRFGLPPSTTIETLEEIGEKLKVTRERVRQITKTSVAHVAVAAEKSDEVQRFVAVAEHLLRAYGGAVEKQFYADQLLDFTHITKNSSDWVPAHVCLDFLLGNILTEFIELRPETTTLKPVYTLARSESKILGLIADIMEGITSEAGHPLTDDELVKSFLSTPLATADYENIIQAPVLVAREFYGSGLSSDATAEADETARVVLAYAAAVVELDRNIFLEWGKRTWSTIRPRRMNDKIYLILKHEKKPLHFTTITERINAAHFDTKIARAPSVHNELILDTRFVLVGRGIYALKEWGYKAGTVADVVEDILKDGCTLTRQQIVEAVLQKRFVKKQTIHLALMNASRFEKMPDGRYGVVSKEKR